MVLLLKPDDSQIFLERQRISADKMRPVFFLNKVFQKLKLYIKDFENPVLMIFFIIDHELIYSQLAMQH